MRCRRVCACWVIILPIVICIKSEVEDDERIDQISFILENEMQFWCEVWVSIFFIAESSLFKFHGVLLV